MADSLGSALFARVQAVSALYSLIGGTTTPRFYPGRLPQDPTYPACCWQLIAEERRALGGSTGHDGVPRSRVQISVFSRTRTEALSVLNDGVKAAFTAWAGTSASITVQGTSLEDVTEVGFDARARVWQFAADYYVWYQGA